MESRTIALAPCGGFGILERMQNSILPRSEGPLRQIKNIDRLYSRVKTEWVSHCEDDWEFFGEGSGGNEANEKRGDEETRD